MEDEFKKLKIRGKEIREILQVRKQFVLFKNSSVFNQVLGRESILTTDLLLLGAPALEIKWLG